MCVSPCQAAYTFDAGPNAVIYTLKEHKLDVLACLLRHFPPADGVSLDTFVAKPGLGAEAAAHSVPAALDCSPEDASPGAVRHVYITKVRRTQRRSRLRSNRRVTPTPYLARLHSSSNSPCSFSLSFRSHRGKIASCSRSRVEGRGSWRTRRPSPTWRPASHGRTREVGLPCKEGRSEGRSEGEGAGARPSPRPSPRVCGEDRTVSFARLRRGPRARLRPTSHVGNRNRRCTLCAPDRRSPGAAPRIPGTMKKIWIAATYCACFTALGLCIASLGCVASDGRSP